MKGETFLQMIQERGMNTPEDVVVTVDQLRADLKASEGEVERQEGTIKHLENRLELHKNVKISGNPRAAGFKDQYERAEKAEASLAVAVEALEGMQKDVDSFENLDKPGCNQSWLASRLSFTVQQTLKAIEEM